ncbi:HEAT repeat domain-containing protein [Desulfotignum balticum]|uniref:HEAT repeat domain-containing protein n=1 Tax=Desulfotignum balticum TaxID=115781 RepID=UPI0003FCAD56|nr:HEAT repeat domain-containing protein [Desulfotignum balticum]
MPAHKILADWAVRESRELDAAVADWSDLDQLIQALETPWIFIFPKLTQAFKAIGDRAIEALIAAHSRPAFHGPAGSILTAYLLKFEDRAIPYLTAALNDPSIEVQTGAARALTRYRKDDLVPVFMGLLKRTEPRLRKSALLFLKEYGRKNVRNRVIEILRNDEDRSVRIAAAKVLYTIAGPGSLEALRRYICASDTHRDEKLSIMAFLTDNTGPLIHDTIAALVNDPDTIVRCRAIEKLAGWQASDMAGAFMDLLDDPEPLVRATAAEALGILGYRPAAGRLLDLLALRDSSNRYSDRCVWLCAAEALGRLKDERAIPKLLAAVHDVDKYEGRIILDALLMFDNNMLAPMIRKLEATGSEQVRINAAEVLDRVKTKK